MVCTLCRRTRAEKPKEVRAPAEKQLKMSSGESVPAAASSVTSVTVPAKNGSGPTPSNSQSSYFTLAVIFNCLTVNFSQKGKALNPKAVAETADINISSLMLNAPL